MSKKIKNEQKKLLGQTLNEYDKALDEAINQLDKKNREQNHKISSLVNSFDNEYLEKDVEGNMTTLENSKDGMVIINEIQGNTEVNYCKDGEKELILNGDIDTQGKSFVTLTEGVDGGLVDVSLEGNTEVNLSSTKDPVLVTREFDDINCNSGKLQYTIDDVTTINDEPGKVDIDRIVGDTMVNHAVNGLEELILNAYINESGDNNITLNGVTSDGGKVDVALEGNTLVNVSKTKDSTAITKAYTVENSGNHIALQGDVDGSCKPVITGNTLVNLFNETNFRKSDYVNLVYWDGNILKTSSQAIDSDRGNIVVLSYVGSILKQDTVYTFVIRTKGTFRGYIFGNNFTTQINNEGDGVHKLVFTYNGSTNESYRIWVDTATPTNLEVEFLLLLEGDYTNKPIPGYFEGLQSSFEDKVVTQEMIDNGEELAENLGKYKVDYVISREDGTVGFTKTFYLNSPLLEGDTIEQQGNNVVHVHRSEIRVYQTDDELTLPTDMTNTLVAKATPQYEVISQNDSILCDSYVNGHLDVDSVVPIEKVNFLHFEEELAYLYPSTSYTLQFNSDNATTVDITLGGKELLAQSIVKGLNRVTITTPETLIDNKLIIDGVGANISEVVVTNTDRDFGYFEGMKSAGECEDLEMVSSNKNLFNGKWEFNEAKTSKTTDFIKINNNVVTCYMPGYIKSNGTRYLSVMLYDENKSLIKYHALGDGNACYSYDNLGNFSYIRISMSTTITDCDFDVYDYKINIPNLYTGEHIPHQSNTQTLTHEPLRAVEDIKDRYVLIDGKWYIERNCAEVVLDGSDDEGWIISNQNQYGNDNIYGFFITGDTIYNLKPGSTFICNKLPSLGLIGSSDITDNTNEYIAGTKFNTLKFCLIGISKSKLSSNDIIGLKAYLQLNPLTIIYELASPQYEPIDYNPFEVYSDITHISNNSTIPCNMVIKNHGYNMVALKENTQYTLYVNKDTTNALTYRLGDYVEINSLSKFTFTTPSTLTDKTLRIDGKGNSVKDLMLIEETPANDPVGYFDGLKSSYECERVTDESDENYGKYKVEVVVKCLDDESFESKQTIYLNSPLLKGDEIVWKDNKIQHYHKMETIVLDGSDDEIWYYDRSTDTHTGYYSGNIVIIGHTPLYCDKFKFIKDYNDTSSYGAWKTRNDEAILNCRNVGINISNSKLVSQDVAGFRQWLQQNPTTVVYQLATPYYEEISLYPLKLNAIANSSLSTESTIQVTNISFNVYEETLPYLYSNTKYYITFNADVDRNNIIIDLGGSHIVFDCKVGFNKVEITTPSDTTNLLTFSGTGVNIDHVKVTQQDIDEYFEGMKSVGECEGNTLEIICKNNDNSKSITQTLIHEPLRSVGDIKDKYVLIDGKWYIERNIICIDITSTTDNIDKVISWGWVGERDTEELATISIKTNKYFKTNSKLLSNAYVIPYSTIDNWLNFQIKKSELSSTTITNDILKEWCYHNKVIVCVQLQTPQYEPIDYNPFEVYSDVTHISTNSLIPSNMVIKNHGYNTILKPSTKYTIALNKSDRTIGASLGGSAKVDSTNSIFTITTPSTLNDNVLRLSGSGKVKDIMILEGDKTVNTPSYFEGIESAFEQEYDTEKGKYRVTAKVEGDGKENNITFYINEPLRSVGNAKDKVFIKDDKVIVQRNCGSAIFDGSEDENWRSPSENVTPNSYGIVEFSLPFGILNINQWYEGLCDKFNVRGHSNVLNKEAIGLNGYGKLISIDILASKLSDISVDGFRQWLQQNPITVVYELTEPIYEEADCDLSKLVLENYENSSLIFESNIPVSANIRYSGEVPIVSQAKTLSSQVDNTTLDINENIIPYMCDIDYRIVELQLMNGDTQGEGIELLGIGDIEILGNENVLFNNREDKKYNYSYDMLKRDIISNRYSKEEYQYRLDRYLLANKISDEEYKELEGLLNNGE